jgi:hypothetical protein
VGFPSVGVYRNVGFKNGAWHDVAWYERVIAPHDSSPDPPISLRDEGMQRQLQDALGRLAGIVGAKTTGLAPG